jgi:hypothetical protein
MDQESLSEWEDWSSLIQEPQRNSVPVLAAHRFKTSLPLKDTIGSFPDDMDLCQSAQHPPTPLVTAIPVNNEENQEEGQPEYKF